jgi:hypothetical protein
MNGQQTEVCDPRPDHPVDRCLCLVEPPQKHLHLSFDRRRRHRLKVNPRSVTQHAGHHPHRFWSLAPFTNRDPANSREATGEQPRMPSLQTLGSQGLTTPYRRVQEQLHQSIDPSLRGGQPTSAKPQVPRYRRTDRVSVESLALDRRGADSLIDHRHKHLRRRIKPHAIRLSLQSALPTTSLGKCCCESG